MTPEEQRALVIEHLERTESIASRTKAAVEEKAGQSSQHPLDQIDPELRKAVEAEFFAARGRQKYVSSDGRARWLTPDEIEKRTRAKAAGQRRKSTYYGPHSAYKRTTLTWSFNIGAVLLALIIVWLIVF